MKNIGRACHEKLDASELDQLDELNKLLKNPYPRMAQEKNIFTLIFTKKSTAQIIFLGRSGDFMSVPFHTIQQGKK